jgi:hypothetical protein
MSTLTTIELPRNLRFTVSDSPEPITDRFDRIAIRREAAVAIEVLFVIGLLALAAMCFAGIAS